MKNKNITNDYSETCNSGFELKDAITLSDLSKIERWKPDIGDVGYDLNIMWHNEPITKVDFVMASSSDAQLMRGLKEFMEYLNDNYKLVWFSADCGLRRQVI